MVRERGIWDRVVRGGVKDRVVRERGCGIEW